MRLNVAGLLLLLCLFKNALAEEQVVVTLGELLRANAAAGNISFVLEQGLTLEQQLIVKQRDWRDPGQLARSASDIRFDLDP